MAWSLKSTCWIFDTCTYHTRQYRPRSRIAKMGALGTSTCLHMIACPKCQKLGSKETRRESLAQHIASAKRVFTACDTAIHPRRRDVADCVRGTAARMLNPLETDHRLLGLLIGICHGPLTSALDLSAILMTFVLATDSIHDPNGLTRGIVAQFVDHEQSLAHGSWMFCCSPEGSPRIGNKIPALGS